MFVYFLSDTFPCEQIEVLHAKQFATCTQPKLNNIPVCSNPTGYASYASHSRYTTNNPRCSPPCNPASYPPPDPCGMHTSGPLNINKTSRIMYPAQQHLEIAHLCLLFFPCDISSRMNVFNVAVLQNKD